MLDKAKSTTACATSLRVVYEIILVDLNLAVSTLTTKLPSLILGQISGYMVCMLQVVYPNISHAGMGECACTSDIKQLLGKMDIIQNSVAANNASYRGKLSSTTHDHTR